MFNFFAFLMILCVVAALFSMYQMLLAVGMLKKQRQEKLAMTVAQVQAIEDNET